MEFKERKELTLKELGSKIGFHMKAITDLMHDCARLEPIKPNVWRLLNEKKYSHRSVSLIQKYKESLTIDQAKKRLTAEWLLDSVMMDAAHALDICDIIAQREAAKMIVLESQPAETLQTTSGKKKTPQRPKDYRFPRAINETKD